MVNGSLTLRTAGNCTADDCRISTLRYVYVCRPEGIGGTMIALILWIVGGYFTLRILLGLWVEVFGGVRNAHKPYSTQQTTTQFDPALPYAHSTYTGDIPSKWEGCQ